MTTPPNYDPDQPVARDTFAQSQPEFLDNFAVLFDTFEINHISLDSVSNAGNHANIQLLQQGTFNQDKPPQTDISDFSIFTQDVEGQTDQVFLRYPGNGQQVQLTAYQIYKIGDGTQFFTYIPGGSIIYFGQVSISSQLGISLFLQPAVCKNIVTVATCFNSGTIANQKPIIIPVSTPQQVFNRIDLQIAVGANAQTFFYVVWGNT